MQKTTTYSLCFLLAVIGSMTGTAGAVMIDVSFIGGGPVTVTGAGVVGSGGDYWNGVTTLGTSGSNIALSNTSDQPTGLPAELFGAGGDGGPFYSPTPSPNPNLTSTYADSFTGNNPNNVISLALGGFRPADIDAPLTPMMSPITMSEPGDPGSSASEPRNGEPRRHSTGTATSAPGSRGYLTVTFVHGESEWCPEFHRLTVRRKS